MKKGESADQEWNPGTEGTLHDPEKTFRQSTGTNS